MFARLYDSVLRWSRHRHASWYLAGLSFAESSFFPVPPDVMLAPMTLATPQRAWFYAGLTTLTSTLGGVLGYVIGAMAFDAVLPMLESWGYLAAYEQSRLWFNEWGIWVVFLAGFTPIPYKIFTISAGVASMALLPFIIASFIGRGARFFLVAGIIWYGGEKMERFLRRYIERVGWLLIILGIIMYVIVQNGI